MEEKTVPGVKRALRDHSIDINHTNEEGKTALIKAAEQSNNRLIDLLLKNGANPNDPLDNQVSFQMKIKLRNENSAHNSLKFAAK